MEKLSNTIVTVIPARQTLRDKIRSLQIFELKKKHVKRVFKSGIVGIFCLYAVWRQNLSGVSTER